MKKQNWIEKINEITKKRSWESSLFPLDQRTVNRLRESLKHQQWILRVETRIFVSNVPCTGSR